MQTQSLKSLVRRRLPTPAILMYREWQQKREISSDAREEERLDRRPLPRSDPGPSAVVAAALGWLCRAQDKSVSSDGGVARHYSLNTGWSDSYPETTGYIIPTFIDSGGEPNRDALVERARRMLDWCTDIQIESGAFPGGTVSATRCVPTTFNTGQILLGLAAGAGSFGDTRYETAMHRAAAWLRDTQDADGCWRRFPTPFARSGEKTYETHVSWGLFEAARLAPECGYGEAGLRQVLWALDKQRSNGWFADCCLSDCEKPLTHTIGYALRGVIEAFLYSRDSVFLHAALRTGRGLLSCLRHDGSLPGRLHANWRPAVSWVCLTGAVQISHCWLLLFELTGERAFRDAARRCNAFVRRTVRVDGAGDTVGGVKGSFPVDGEYGRYEYLNWAAKFLIDANRLELAVGR